MSSYILISILIRSKFERKTTKGKAIIKDGVSLTSYDDPNINKRSFRAMKRKKDCELQNGILIEHLPGIKKEEIASKIEIETGNSSQ